MAPLLELTVENAPNYCIAQGLRVQNARVTELGGGVSNTVLLVESPSQRFVLKQALGKLRVEQDWYSDRRRIFRESAGLRIARAYLPDGAVPRILFEDRVNGVYGMEAAPAQARTWKSRLLEGDASEATAASIGSILGALTAASWRQAAWEQSFGDQTVFGQLRLDPYYRATAARHPDLAPRFDDLIAQAARRLALVHGDWSPKNFLTWNGRVMAIDFEVVHYGDPAFDTAFLLNHLCLKALYRPEWRARYHACARAFWRAYRAVLPPDGGATEGGTIAHLAGLMLARIDGKSPVEYIEDAALKDHVRAVARGLFTHPPLGLDGVFERL